MNAALPTFLSVNMKTSEESSWRLGAFLVAGRKLRHDGKMRMQNQSVAVIESTCAFSRQVLLAGGIFLQEEEDEGDDQQDRNRKHAY